MALRLAWKHEDFGPDAPHIAVEYTSGRWAGTYGVWVALDGEGHARPVGSGRGLTRDAAVKGAQDANMRMRSGGTPSRHGRCPCRLGVPPRS